MRSALLHVAAAALAAAFLAWLALSKKGQG